MEVTSNAIEARVRTVLHSPQNTLKELCEAAFPMPLIGYADGNRPPFMSADGRGSRSAAWLASKFGDGYTPDHICVISWALPMPEEIRVTMRGRRSQPSLEWMMAIASAEQFNLAIARAITSLLDEQQICAVSPLAETIYQRMTVEKYGAGLEWSESVAAVAAGIGEMRSARGIVTAEGSCVALGSVIAAASMPNARRAAPASMHFGSCNGCTACQDRCPAKAIRDDGFDGDLCLKYQSQFVLPYLKAQYGFQGKAACDLCMMDVPCERGPNGSQMDHSAPA